MKVIATGYVGENGEYPITVYGGARLSPMRFSIPGPVIEEAELHEFARWSADPDAAVAYITALIGKHRRGRR